MAIPTSRTKTPAEISIDSEKCTGCGLCVSVCKDFSIAIKEGKVEVHDHPLFGCIGCGHCMAICPSGAIEVSGREFSPHDLYELPDRKDAATYEQLHILFQRRRSVREFREAPVDGDLIKKILDTARTAPMGLPPSDVNVLVLNSREKVRSFAEDFCSYLGSMKWIVSGWFLFLMRPFWSKESHEMFKNFVRPLLHAYTENIQKGVNLVSYDAPLAMYFYGSPYADPADPIIAATYAMAAAEALGLSTCMIGGVHPFIQNGRKAKVFREKQGIRSASREGLFVLFGYPKVNYTKGIQRTFASTEEKQ
ncbi:nitroreductase family protein [Prosthecochloris sp. SCSIO W1101]|uniref:nitroreductase family protein n=1 Tax=Prosthecochloris sp. SCSIO W1101 TaxID=2992242 RepID=UPI00223E8DA2|nr:nitroreductase family protein [Prosthecochloris sp. SCSIO W1101]UZJ41316.1 nitroreductase family protein [Prosthecochloris sp. SCSIO W1101]